MQQCHVLVYTFEHVSQLPLRLVSCGWMSRSDAVTLSCIVFTTFIIFDSTYAA